MTRVLVTGRTGQLGHSIAELADDPRFAALDLHVLSRTECDLADSGSIAGAIDRIDPAVIINAGAFTAVDAAETDQAAAFLANRDGVADLAAASGRRLIQVSTDYVFDGTKPEWYVESDPVAPLGVYGQSKWQGEEAARTNPDHLILRTAWVYASHGHNFVKTMLRLGAERDRLRVVADQVGCPTSARDLAAALLALATADLVGTFHLAGTEQATWHEFAVAIFHTAGLAVEVDAITTAEYPTPAPRPANSRLDSGALAEATGIRLPGWRSSLPPVIDEILTTDPIRTSP